MLARGRVGETLFGAEQRAVQRSTGAGVVDDVDDSARRSPIMPALCQWATMLLSDVSLCVGGGEKSSECVALSMQQMRAPQASISWGRMQWLVARIRRTWSS